MKLKNANNSNVTGYSTPVDLNENGVKDYLEEGSAVVSKTYPAKDSTKQELKDFIENLSQEAFKKIRKFFDTMPQLRHEIEVENPKTKVKNKITFKGLQDFFQ